MSDCGNVRQFPAHRRATGYEHMTNDEFVIAAFGPEALAFMKSASPEQMKGVWMKPVDQSRFDDVTREFKRRCGVGMVSVAKPDDWRPMPAEPEPAA